ncbi:MAG: hypothetical protein SGI92_23805 [Bryobacteraceae bacterium]|nr:hypothetical protein [Bryobacteraceae bacterium]
MATLNQINASRINGARSKGPVTPKGKARVAQNGTTHGIYSTQVVLHNEETAAYLSLRQDLINDWAPVSSFELNLINDIADARWRLLRFTTLETAALDFEVERMRPEVAETFQSIDEGTRTIFAFNALILHNRTFEVLQTGIRAQHRIIDRATAQLIRFLKIRPDLAGGNSGATTTASETAPTQDQVQTAQPPASETKPAAIDNHRTKPEPAPIPQPRTAQTITPVAPSQPGTLLDRLEQALASRKPAA